MNKFFLSFILILNFIECTKHKARPLPQKLDTSYCDTPSYANQIQPLLNANCVSCHGSGNPNGDFTNYAGTIQKIQGSNPFKNRVLENPNNPMPPSGQLPADKRKIIECWLKAGAPNN
ncbi:MAG: cytochrome c [Bacteroidia bacterium]|nr:cytochrome c [Bacteroidia bacterium]